MSETEDPMIAVLTTENTRRPQVTVALLPRLTEMAKRLSAVRSAIKRGTHTKDSSYSRWSLVYEIRPAHTADDDGEDWLGVECLHPLTWLPAPGSAVTRSLLASAAGT